MSTAIPLTLLDTIPCKTWSCPHLAERGDELCAFCRRMETMKAKLVARGDNLPIHDAIMQLIPLLGRYEIEQERDPTGVDYRIALHELKAGVARAARSAARLA